MHLTPRKLARDCKLMQILKSDINVIALPALSDNYIWILASDKMNGIYVVDPGDSRPVLNWLNNKHLPLKGILITHHHPDHVGGSHTGIIWKLCFR